MGSSGILGEGDPDGTPRWLVWLSVSLILMVLLVGSLMYCYCKPEPRMLPLRTDHRRLAVLSGAEIPFADQLPPMHSL